MATANKVKFGLKNCYFAVASFDDDGNATYETPVKMPGAVSLSLDANGENENFYADDGVYYVIGNNSGYEGDLELAMIPESFLTDVLGEITDANGVLIESAANTDQVHFALLFEFSGDQNKIRHVFYNCTASRPSIEGQTNEDTKEVKTETISISAAALPNDTAYVKGKTASGTDSTTYDGWYSAVYVPSVTTAS